MLNGDLRVALILAAVALSVSAFNQSSAGIKDVEQLPHRLQAADVHSTSISSAVKEQYAQPSRESTVIELYAPYVAAVLALLGVIGTAIYSLRRGQMDARYTYASETLKFRLRQIQEFYSPAFLLIEQERKDVSLTGFRLLDHIYVFRKDPKLEPLVDRVINIGNQLTKLITERSGLIEGGITPTLIEYQAHFEILNAASEQELSAAQIEGWHEFGYYPRMLNWEIREGYKAVLAHFESYVSAGDQIISRLLGQKVVEVGAHRHQLIENLRFYEENVKDYVAKFDSFDLSGVRQSFIDAVENTRSARAKSLTNGMINILDVGCGTGRDTYQFLKRGYAVTAVDASPAMLRECSRKLRDARQDSKNQNTRQAATASCSLEATFDEIKFRNRFDGVWAAAALLHVPSRQMEDILRKLLQALKPNGILFMSFKYGQGEHEYDARFYSYYGIRNIRTLLKRVTTAGEVNIWLSNADGRKLSRWAQFWHSMLEFFGRYDRKLWLNAMVRRSR